MARNLFIPRRGGPWVADPGTPLYVAHRCGDNVYPEASQEAAQGIIAEGVKAVEWDNYLTTDGSLLVMHDPTITRTTDGTGNSVDQTEAMIQALSLDTSSWFGSSKFGNLKVPTCEDILRVAGGRAVVFPEAKNEIAGAALAALIVRLGLQKSAVIQGGTFPTYAAAEAAGIETLHLSSNGSTPVADLNTYGIEWVGCDVSVVSTAAVDTYVAAGIKVALYAVNRRSDRDAWLAHGVSAFISDDPIYLASAAPLRTTDPFSSKTWYHGMQKASVGVRGIFLGTNRWGFAPGAAGKSFVLQGWACPLGGAGGVPASYTVSFTLTFDAIPAGSETSHGDIAVCAATDVEYADAGAATENLYNCIMRANGQMQIFRRVGGTSTTLASFSGTAVSAGQAVPMQLIVTPTSVTLKRTDTNQQVSASDATHRGGYFHLGGNSSLVPFAWSFSGVSVT